MLLHELTNKELLHVFDIVSIFNNNTYVLNSTVYYRLSTHFFWYAPRLKYALIQKDVKKITIFLYKFFINILYIYTIFK